MPSLSGLSSFLNRFPRVPLRFTLGFAHGVPLRATQESGLLHTGLSTWRPAARDSNELFTFELESKRILTQALFLNTSLQRMICVPIVLSLPSLSTYSRTGHNSPTTGHCPLGTKFLQSSCVGKCQGHQILGWKLAQRTFEAVELRVPLGEIKSRVLRSQ